MRLIARLATLVALAAAASTAEAQWTPQRSGTTASLRGLHAVNDSVVWASGTKGTVLRTVDGGARWEAHVVTGADSLDFRDVQGLDARTAVVASAGNPARLYRTADGGRRWTQVYQHPDTTAFFDGLTFWDARNGVVYSDPVGGRWVVLLTSDGGRTWRPLPSEALPAPLAGEASFAASGTGIAAMRPGTVWFATGGGRAARVFRSEDRGRRWTAAETPVVAGEGAAGIFSIAFADRRRGVAVGGVYTKPASDSANAAVTTDGGRSWRLPKGRRPGGYRSGAAAVPGTRGRTFVAVGTTGTDLSTDGGESWTAIGTEGFNSVTFATRDDGWAVGDKGRVARWTPSK